MEVPFRAAVRCSSHHLIAREDYWKEPSPMFTQGLMQQAWDLILGPRSLVCSKSPVARIGMGIAAIQRYEKPIVPYLGE